LYLLMSVYTVPPSVFWLSSHLTSVGFIVKYWTYSSLTVGRDSSVSIVTGYRLDSLGIESWWGQFFTHVQTSCCAHPVSCAMGTGRGLLLLITHPLLALKLQMIEIYLYSPQGLL
jgi:hypothetical protein